MTNYTITPKISLGYKKFYVFLFNCSEEFEWFVELVLPVAIELYFLTAQSVLIGYENICVIIMNSVISCKYLVLRNRFDHNKTFFDRFFFNDTLCPNFAF